MRVKLKFNLDNDIVLPVHYNSLVQGFIYNYLSDKSFATFLHELGYGWNKRKFKLFTFSRLIGKYQIDKDKNNIVFKPPIYLILSSIKNEIIQELVANVVKESWIRLGSQEVFLDDVQFESFEKGPDKLMINMLSPLVVYSTNIVAQKKKTYYYSPWEEEFKEQIENNLFKKYQLINHNNVKRNFQIKPLFSSKEKPRIIMYRNFVIKGWIGKFSISGTPELLQIGYATGLGAKNSMGFGCFEVVEQGKQVPRIAPGNKKMYLKQ